MGKGGPKEGAGDDGGIFPRSTKKYALSVAVERR